MSQSNPAPISHGDDLAATVRAVRARYDKLERGQVAQLRRCRSAADLELEGGYWRVVGSAAKGAAHHLAHVVLLFPYAAQGGGAKFSMGRFLHRYLGDGSGATLRVRRLLACETRDELDHRLRAILRFTSAAGGRVDWGVLGRDILWFLAESEATRRRWAQDFYAPIGAAPDATAATTPTA
jgi:CRISPR type I-E-associated protein CasB/Cse2